MTQPGIESDKEFTVLCGECDELSESSDSHGKACIEKNLENSVKNWPELDDSDESDTVSLHQPENNISMFDSTVRDTVHRSIKTACILSLALFVIFPFMLSLFYGFAWNPKDNYGNIKIGVFDLDGGVIGQTIMGVAKSSTVPFAVTTFSHSTTLQAIMDQVESGDFHAALVVNANASDALKAALTNPNLPYLPSAATTFIFDEGRGGPTMASILRSGVPVLATNGANAVLAQLLLKKLSAEGVKVGQINRKAIITPIGNTELNVHPVQYFGETVATGLGYFLNWLLTSITVLIMFFFLRSWDNASIRKDHQIFAHYFGVACITFFLALWPSAVITMFGVGLSVATFFRLWGFFWLTTLAFGGILMAQVRGLGPAVAGSFNSIFLLVNFICSPAMAPVEIAYAPLRLGLALPFHNALEGSRAILFGSWPTALPRNAAVITGWIVLMFSILSVLALRERRRALRKAAEIARAKAAKQMVRTDVVIELAPPRVRDFAPANTQDTDIVLAQEASARDMLFQHGELSLAAAAPAPAMLQDSPAAGV